MNEYIEQHPDCPTPRTDAAAGNYKGIELCAAFETSSRQMELEIVELNQLIDEIKDQDLAVYSAAHQLIAEGHHNTRIAYDTLRDALGDSESGSPAYCSGVEMLAFLVDETSEDAVFCFLSAISAFGVETMEHAQQVYQGDADVRRWVEVSYRLIPQND